ncbi:drug resistance transporter, EmrB/QacA subfamily [Streptomyces lincolnensis]|uniref:Drug resistance transporter, EmrB/QacA subfamily n=1 Tax=Streptomyces lincolnensis TaxID=1915 RepID=A0A1B1MFI1_STRLN|nr:MFS transporter [Streptomyces lincolnensis]ANS67142.1 drug resistance transporter, EmrB/QacA subfamily [Streptomyces lincolnensis]AXG56013.1 drug resistance transporter, EmrB/QacA subfamily [Streptomyces lincolnensis]QMV07512.1 DHA2 family efflux MFS transporter permease subunit [Streptomyces lincolnensis]
MEAIPAATAHAVPSGHTHAAPKHRWWALAVIGLAQLMVVLDATIVNIALPSAQQDLGFDNNGRQWIVTAYSLAFGSLLLLGGRLADLFGRKTTFIVGLVGFAVASAVGGAANGFTMLVVARAVQGLFGALLAPAALSLLTTTFTEPKERARAFGIFGAIAGSGAAVGLVLGGLLTEYLDWRWTLYVNDVIAVFALIGAVVFLGRSVPTERPKLDIPGVILVSGGLFGIVYGFANAETHDWDNWMTWGFLAAGGVLLVAFFLWQTRAKHPVLPLRVLADRDRAAALSTILISSAGMFGVFLFLTYYLQSTLGYSPVKNGVAFLPMVAALMVMAQLSTNVLIPKIGPKIIVPTGMLVAAGGMVWLTRLGLDSSYAAHVLPPLLLLGAGLGTSMPAAMSYATLGVQAQDQGVASAALNTTQQVGGSISTALLNTLAATAATNYAADHLSDPMVKANAALHSYEVAYWWSAAFFAVGVVITVLLFRAKKQRVAAPQEETGTHTEAPAPATAPTAATATLPAVDSAVIRGQVRDGSGAPVPRTAITLLDGSGRQLARATSHEDGTYGLDTPERGSLVLIGSAPGYQPQVATLSLNGTPVSHDLVFLPSPGGLTGTVRGGDDAALSGALVVATDQHGDVTASTTTDTDGAYRIGDLLPGDYTLSVSAPGHRPTAVPATVSADTTRCDIHLTVAATLRGTVHTPDGRALDDARVTLIDAAGNVVGTRTTSVDGTYAFTDLASDQYTVIASGYPPVATQLTVNGTQEGVDILLTHKEA